MRLLGNKSQADSCPSPVHRPQDRPYWTDDGQPLGSRNREEEEA